MVIMKTESDKMETVTVKTEMVDDCDDPDEESGLRLITAQSWI